MEYEAFLDREGVARVIDPLTLPFRSRVKSMTFTQIMFGIIVIGALLPFIVLFFGIVALVIWDHL